MGKISCLVPPWNQVRQLTDCLCMWQFLLRRFEALYYVIFRKALYILAFHNIHCYVFKIISIKL
jgi:hypothetical protein